MEITELMPFIAQALGGVLASNLMGALTRGGGGILGRTIVGALAGVGAGQIAEHILPGDIYATLFNLIDGDNGTHLGNGLTGAGGGAILGILTGIFIRPSI